MFEVPKNPHSSEIRESATPTSFPTHYHGIPFTDIIAKYWELNNHGFEPTIGDRDTLTYQLACDLRHICAKNADWLDQVIPCYNGFPIEEKRAKIKSALSSEYNGFPMRLRNVLNALSMSDGRGKMEDVESAEDEQLSTFNSQLSTRKMPQGVRESIDAVGPSLAMPVVTAICPCIGTLATGVQLDVHGTKRGLNLISYIAGDFASGKGGIDPVVEAWMSELQALDKMYQQQEEEWRAKKRAAKNKKEQPEEPKLPVRCLTLNNTVANLAERLANTEGKHGFSFTPEADTVAQKWKSTMSDFSVMLRQSYDGSKYEREARSADAVNVHIEHLLWNVCMCGTPDALYRVVNNYTDGFQSRIAVARTPDNTFAPLEDKPYVLTDRQRERIQQIAHLLPLMYGEVVLPKLEAKGREWVERIRVETMKNDDRTRARQRFRVCVTAQRMVCCLMLCKVCETLIQKHGLSGAEAQLKQKPGLWKELLLKAQTPTMLEAYDVIADSLLENALYFFRDRIENAFQSRDYAGGLNGERQKRGKNDSIFERLDIQFSFEQAMQHSVAVKGANVNHNTVRQMLKNWRKQGLVVLEEDGNYRKL
jgi:predicted transcriptional regulator